MEDTKLPDGGEDRLSALPDDLLVLILEDLDTTAEAVRTRVLARRWRRLGALLTKLRFHLRPEGNRIRDLLDAIPDTTKLSFISVTTQGDEDDSASIWLPAAARRLAGGLVYRNLLPDAAFMYDNVQLPCFEKAASIELNLSLGGLVFPSMGVFTELTSLCVRSFEFHGSCDLGSLVSSSRCPVLQKLSICYIAGVGNLSIHSESLRQIELKGCDLAEMTLVTPLLEKLSVHHSFPAIADGVYPDGPVVNITAPRIVSLEWIECYDPWYFNLGDLAQLTELQTVDFMAYGGQFSREDNRHCILLLQQFQMLHSLHLPLSYDKELSGYHQFLLGDITVLPQITILQLELCNNGHAFGASVFYLLRMCIGLRKLLLVKGSSEEELACPSDCICDRSKNWKTDELVLGQLEDVCITGLQGSGHEVAFVQRLLGWATVLKTLRMKLDKISEEKTMEFREALAGFSRPETCMHFDTSENK